MLHHATAVATSTDAVDIDKVQLLNNKTGNSRGAVFTAPLLLPASDDFNRWCAGEMSESIDANADRRSVRGGMQLP